MAACFCAIAPREMICSTSKRHTKKLAAQAVRAYKKRGIKLRYKIKRTAKGNC